MDATLERHVIPLNGDEGTFFLNVILPVAYRKLYCKSRPNKMAPLASILWEREQQVARSSLFLKISVTNLLLPIDSLHILQAIENFGAIDPSFAFSNTLIIHEKKTKEITTVRNVWIRDSKLS